MTPEERGAKAASECAHCEDGKLYLSNNFGETIAQHIREAIAEEREACARLADGASDGEWIDTGGAIANNIRARGQ